MPEDRSLDEFAGTDRDDADVDAESDDTDSMADAVGGDGAPDAEEPARSTSTWTTGGAECERCGDVGARRWRDGDAFVCAECAEW